MTKIIINADDFGYSRAINYGIIDSYLNGILTSTTLMVTMPGFEHAVELMQTYPEFPVGLHLNFTFGSPLSNPQEIPSVLDKENHFIKPKDFPDNLKYDGEEVYQEAKLQLEKFVTYTRKFPTHLDTHLFASDVYEEVAEAVKRLANEFKIPVRNHATDYFKHIPFITQRTFDAEAGLLYVEKFLEEILQFDCVEIMSHPGYIDSYVLENTSYNLPRVAEVEFLCSSKFKQKCREKKVEFISYADLESTKEKEL